MFINYIDRGDALAILVAGMEGQTFRRASRSYLYYKRTTYILIIPLSNLCQIHIGPSKPRVYLAYPRPSNLCNA